MKKLLIIFIMLTISSSCVFAKNKVKDKTVNYSGTKYSLLYSTKDNKTGGYLNEYYKRGETYRIWSEMVAVHHFPNAYSPIEQVVDLKKYLNKMNCPSSYSFDDKNNSAMLDFVLVHNTKNAVIMEFNIFKYNKADKSGSVAVQYAKRYAVKNAFEAEAVKKEFEKSRKKAIKNIKKFKTPKVVMEEIDKCKIISEQKEELQNEKAELETDKENKVLNKENDFPEKQNTEISDNDTKIDEIPDKEIIEEKSDIKEDISEEKTITEESDAAKETNSENNEKIIPVKKNTAAEINTEEIPATYKKEIFTVIKEEKDKVSTKKTQQKKVKKEKIKDEKPYRIENTKDDFYSEPRNYKELRIKNKKRLKEIKKAKKINKKKAAKERAKKASKELTKE